MIDDGDQVPGLSRAREWIEEMAARDGNRSVLHTAIRISAIGILVKSEVFYFIGR